MVWDADMLPVSPESIEGLFHYHCDTLKLLQGNPNVAKPVLLDQCIDRCKRRIDDVLTLYGDLYPERIKKFGEEIIKNC